MGDAIKRLKIIGKPYTVKWHKGGIPGEDNAGSCEHMRAVIDVSLNQCEAQKRDTLLHETIHAIDYAAHLALNENQVHALAALLLHTMRDNPKFVEWLMG